ncbi:MAG: hypothetical protein ABJP34_03355 [Erythrobacter sp.]
MRFGSITLTGAALSAGLLVSPVSARDFVGYTSTEPLLYMYAACVFESNDGTAEEQISRCSTVKSNAETSAPAIIELFHVRNRSGVQREFEKGLEEIEKDAEQLRLKSKPVPASIVTYLRCMGQNAMAQPDYLSGDAVSYIGIEAQCATLSFAIEKENTSDRELDAIDALYRRFQRFGRLTYPLASSSRDLRIPKGFRSAKNQRRSANRLQPARRYSRSFLNLSNMRKEKQKND